MHILSGTSNFRLSSIASKGDTKTYQKKISDFKNKKKNSELKDTTSLDNNFKMYVHKINKLLTR